MKSLTAFVCFVVLPAGSLGSWEEWWTYDGISGPSFWGLINPQWMLCNKGRRQSPIDIEPAKMLYDPNLRPLSVDKHKVSGVLHNTGQSLVFRPETGPKHSLAVNVSAGPLAYRYQIEEVFLHYGTDNSHGSEHRIQGSAFPAEIQFYGYNAELYANASEARHKSQGLVAIAVMVQIGETPNPELRSLSSLFGQVIYRGQSADLRHVSLHALLPETDHYMTYEGSTTHPGCWETTSWIIYNKPIYITRQELYALRRLVQGDSETPKGALGNNVRALQPLHHRTVRTNIDFTNSMERGCVTMKTDMSYKANSWNIATT
ncbi:carbonic anhydrase-related protein 10-like isoform X1 [Daphnia pulex]|uniref:carbonic anhydrase-related protein 10-like isoform X1 n=1 Tax=Daphnia pulex TaxID=6669 RepID=UPI001EDED0A3|nr:carbonic anhydrase-related protein 10-like isoform X1 [Daphnia pulex]